MAYFKVVSCYLPGGTYQPSRGQDLKPGPPDYEAGVNLSTMIFGEVSQCVNRQTFLRFTKSD